MSKLTEPPVEHSQTPDESEPWREWLRDIKDRINERIVEILGTAGEIDIIDNGDDTFTIGIVDPLIVAKGGIGVATLTDHGILLGSGVGAVTPLAEASDGQLPIGDAGADPVLNEIDGTTNQVIVTNGPGTIGLSTPQDIHTGAKPTFAGALLTDDLVVPKAAGKGIKVDVAAPTFPWRDLLGDVFARNTGGTKPSFTTYRDTLLDYQFGVADEEYFKFHIPHDYVLGTDIHLHIHWSHTRAAGAQQVNGGTITLGYEMSYAKGHNQAAFPASVSGSITGTASVTQYQHIISEGQVSAAAPSGSQIDSDDLEPDGVIIARLELTANDITVDGGAAPAPFIHYADIHYQSDSVGTKQKAPDFYV